MKLHAAKTKKKPSLFVLWFEDNLPWSLSFFGFLSVILIIARLSDCDHSDVLYWISLIQRMKRHEKVKTHSFLFFYLRFVFGHLNNQQYLIYSTACNIIEKLLFIIQEQHLFHRLMVLLSSLWHNREKHVQLVKIWHQCLTVLFFKVSFHVKVFLVFFGKLGSQSFKK